MIRRLAIPIAATLVLLAACSTTEAPSANLMDDTGIEPLSIHTIANEDQKLAASDGEAFDAFGASVSVSGDIAVIGARDDDDNDNGSDSGSAYVFTRVGGVWTQTAKLTASDGEAIDSFGVSVSVSGDTAVIGAYEDDDNGSDSGSAYVFTRVGGVWTQTSKLTANDGAAFDSFGVSVSVSGDIAVIGARDDDDNGSDSGSAYVFTRDGGVWTQAAKLTASDAAVGDFFGSTVAVSGDTAVIGAYQDDDNGSDSGSAYVFTRVGGVWTQAAKLTANDGEAIDSFGVSVAVSGDTAVIGAFQDDDDGSDSGSAYVFTRVGGVWTQAAKLTASDGEAIDSFGVSVSVSGGTAVIGAYQDDDNGSDSGSAYVFTRDAATGWAQTAKLAASDAAARDYFGLSVAVSGGTAVIGANRDDNDNGSGSGSAYVFSVRTPEQAIESLIASVDALVPAPLKPGQANGLTRPLRNALRSLARDEFNAACSQVADFITEVEAKTPAPLPQPEADALITSADGIRTALECSTQ